MTRKRASQPSHCNVLTTTSFYIISQTSHWLTSLTSKTALASQLEYLAVYGRASMGESWLLDYYRYAIHVLAAFRQLSTHGQKFDPESLYEPI